ncbi:hypothetical protein AVEN_142342-1 [Araneus ventricosus]|uniref:Uncharacterized protein n=1 Tax=Araneus ventricosus TaxID=182803 RepID=A0A4Y2G9P9_ARAVE|nr:hypothetical protein AVEN_142342-1 [Araneus ventricosus]
MNCFMNAKLSDSHCMNGLANGNGHAGVRLYRKRFPTRRVRNHQMFARVTYNLSEHGTFTVPMQDTGRLDVDGLDMMASSKSSQIT